MTINEIEQEITKICQKASKEGTAVEDFYMIFKKFSTLYTVLYRDSITEQIKKQRGK